MKKILLLFTVLIISGAISAQNILLSDGNGPIEPNSTVYVIGEPDQTEPIQARINVTNNTSSAMDILVKKIVVDTLTGTSNYFCWGVCYPAWVYEAQGPVNLEAGATTEGFYGDYVPEGIPGKSHIMYVWWDAANPDDSVAVTVEFNASPAGIDDQANATAITKVYPNPAISFVNFDYRFNNTATDSRIIISNILGAEIMEVELNGYEGTKRINVSELTEGIYFYNVISNDRLIETKKLIIRN
jgi:hypothetical protein